MAKGKPKKEFIIRPSKLIPKGEYTIFYESGQTTKAIYFPESSLTNSSFETMDQARAWIRSHANSNRRYYICSNVQVVEGHYGFSDTVKDKTYAIFIKDTRTPGIMYYAGTVVTKDQRDAKLQVKYNMYKQYVYAYALDEDKKMKVMRGLLDQVDGNISNIYPITEALFEETKTEVYFDGQHTKQFPVKKAEPLSEILRYPDKVEIDVDALAIRIQEKEKNHGKKRT